MEKVDPASGRSAAVGAATYARSYAVLGGMLRSDLEFPELPDHEGEEADWVLDTVHEAAVEGPQQILGSRKVGTESYRLWRTPDGFRLDYSHAGSFDISADGRRVQWCPSPGASLELARAIVLGPVLALALEIRGLLCLHGSGVMVGGHALAFLGPKYHGKSTLATALTAAGSTLISDDLLAVVPGNPPRVRPGVPSVRLWRDTVDRLGVDRLCDSIVPGVKATASGFAGGRANEKEAPLSAIYLLDPHSRHAEPACSRTKLSGAEAAVALAHQTKLPASLVGLGRAGAQLRAAARVAATVDVWRLHLVRDFDRLPETVHRIVSWHGGTGSGHPAMDS